MKVFGNWLYKVSSDEGSYEFKRHYKIDAFEYMIRHKITTITRINSLEKSCVAILDGNSKVIQLFLLDENEHFNIYTVSQSNNERLIDSDNMAYIWFAPNEILQPVYALDGICYEMKLDDWDSENQRLAAIKTIEKVLDKNGLDNSFSDDKILFIKQK